MARIARREFLAISAAAGVMAGLNRLQGSQHTRRRLHIEADWPVARKAQVLQTFLGEHYFDENGLMYSMMRWKDGEDPRPYTLEDFEGYAYLRTSEGFTPRGHINYENSAWTAGHFLTSQCLRYRVTGDEQALEYAARAFRSINRIFQLTEAEGHRGFLCKPYDGRVTTQTSVDQYTSVAYGLWNYRSLAPKKTKERIDYLLPAMIDWWRERKYSQVFFDVDVKGLDANDRTNPSLTAMNIMAYLITGDVSYQREAFRLVGLLGDMPTTVDFMRELLREHGEGCSYPGSPYKVYPVFRDTEYRGATWMSVHLLPFLFQHDMVRAPLFRHALSRYWNYMQKGLRDDLLSYYAIEHDSINDTWAPLNDPLPPDDAKPGERGWHFHRYRRGICWGDATSRVVHCSLMAHQYAHGFCPGALDLARRMLAKLDNQRLLWMIDPDGRQFHRLDEWMGYTLSSDVPAITLRAYWFARLHNIEL